MEKRPEMVIQWAALVPLLVLGWARIQLLWGFLVPVFPAALSPQQSALVFQTPRLVQPLASLFPQVLVPEMAPLLVA
jgi:hypothetical protein